MRVLERPPRHLYKHEGQLSSQGLSRQKPPHALQHPKLVALRVDLDEAKFVGRELGP